MLGRAIGWVCCSLTVALGRAAAGAPPGAAAIGAVPAPGERGAAGAGFRGTVLARGAVAAPVSTFGAAPGATGTATGGRGAEGGDGMAGAAIGTVAAGGGGAPGAAGRGGGGAEAIGAGGGGAAAATGGGSFTGEVAALGAGGGSGADGSWMGAVARFGAEGAGKTLEVATVGTLEVTGFTGAVASRGCTAPSPGRERRVMRTVSFLSGTADVLGVLGGGGVGRFSDSLMRGAGEEN